MLRTVRWNVAGFVQAYNNCSTINWFKPGYLANYKCGKLSEKLLALWNDLQEMEIKSQIITSASTSWNKFEQQIRDEKPYLNTKNYYFKLTTDSNQHQR